MNCPHATPEAVVGQVVEHRQQRRTYRQIADGLQLGASTVGRLLRHAGLNRLSDLEPWPVTRSYEYAARGDILHLGIKKLGRFWRPGHRVTASPRHRRPPARIRWCRLDFVHVAIDASSRVAHSCVLPDERARGAFRALLRSLRHYPSLGARFTGSGLPRCLPSVTHLPPPPAPVGPAPFPHPGPTRPHQRQGRALIQTASREWA